MNMARVLHACRPLEDLRVSITGGVHFDLVKRVLRDINRSGQAPEEIIQQASPAVRFALCLPQGSMGWGRHSQLMELLVCMFPYVHICV